MKQKKAKLKLLLMIISVVLIGGIIFSCVNRPRNKFEETEIIAAVNLMGTGYQSTIVYETKGPALFDGNTYYFKSYSYVEGKWLGSFFQWEGALKDGRIDGKGTLTRYGSSETEVTKYDDRKETGVTYTGTFVNGLPDGAIQTYCEYGSHHVTGIQEYTAGRITGICDFYDETGRQVEYRDTTDMIHKYYLAYDYNAGLDAILIRNYDPPREYDFSTFPEPVPEPPNVCGVAYTND